MKNKYWISEEEEKCRLKFLDDYKKFEQDFYCDFSNVVWNESRKIGTKLKKKKVENKTEIKEGKVSIYKLEDSYLLKTSTITQWISKEDVEDLKKVLNKFN